MSAPCHAWTFSLLLIVAGLMPSTGWAQKKPRPPLAQQSSSSNLPYPRERIPSDFPAVSPAIVR